MHENKEAKYYRTFSNNEVQCLLCPHLCRLRANQFGFCRVRQNINGKLIAHTYGQLSAIHLDPMEKKPLYHYHPGRPVLSVGSWGCNLRCNFCQNWQISQSGVAEKISHQLLPAEIVRRAKNTKDNIGIAYTYNEPTVYFEMMLETAQLAKENDLKNIMVSNGFINEAPLDDLLETIDAFNIDLKAFSNDFYVRHTRSKIRPVMQSLKQIAHKGKHLEITFLLIPGLNDDIEVFREMLDFIFNEISYNTALHLSRYFPVYKQEAPITPEKTMNEFYEIAAKKLPFVYLGNMHTGRDTSTYCPKCGSLLLDRRHGKTEAVELKIAQHNDRHYCKVCGYSWNLT